MYVELRYRTIEGQLLERTIIRDHTADLEAWERSLRERQAVRPNAHLKPFTPVPDPLQGPRHVSSVLADYLISLMETTRQTGPSPSPCKRPMTLHEPPTQRS